MPWLLLEDGRLMNPDTGIMVEFREMGAHAGKAITWAYGVPLHGESRIAGEYFGAIRDKILATRAIPQGADSTSGVENGA